MVLLLLLCVLLHCCRLYFWQGKWCVHSLENLPVQCFHAMLMYRCMYFGVWLLHYYNVIVFCSETVGFGTFALLTCLALVFFGVQYLGVLGNISGLNL